MSKHLFKPPLHLVKEWPEIFEDLYMNTMPVAYIDHVIIEFTDGRVWQIDIQDQIVQTDVDAVTDKILGIFQEYRVEIKKIDFQMDIERLKKDINQSTKDLL